MDIAGGTAAVPGTPNIIFGLGISLPLGLGLAVTALIASLDATAVTAGDAVVRADFR